jgi:hypothetical protein
LSIAQLAKAWTAGSVLVQACFFEEGETRLFGPLRTG